MYLRNRSFVQPFQRGIPFWGPVLFRIICSQVRRSYYLFFNYLSYYMYMCPVSAEDVGVECPVTAEISFKKVSRNSVENSPESPVPVDKSRGDNRLGRSVKPQERFQR